MLQSCHRHMKITVYNTADAFLRDCGAFILMKYPLNGFASAGWDG